jgi:hypothetical protein
VIPEHAVALLASTHLDEVESARQWLLDHPAEAVPALIASLRTGPAAQAAAELLGEIGDDTAIAPLVAAHARGGAGLRAAVEEALARHPSPAAAAALSALR